MTPTVTQAVQLATLLGTATLAFGQTRESAADALQVQTQQPDRGTITIQNSDFISARVRAMTRASGHDLLGAPAAPAPGQHPALTADELDRLVRRARALGVAIEIPICPVYAGGAGRGGGRAGAADGANLQTTCVVQGVNLGGGRGR